MIEGYEKIDDNLKNEICTVFEKKYDFDDLKKSFPHLDHTVLYSVLHSAGIYKQSIYNSLCQAIIDDSKLLIISDTHYGSIYENMDYTYNVFDFATKNGINIILHGGDIIESSIHNKNGLDSKKQAYYFINNFPTDSNITTYAIFGNHDYLAINENETVRDILCSRKDINILGFKKAYLKWCRNVISLQHDIKKYKLRLPVNADYLSFKGHSHYYHIEEKHDEKCERVYIPSLSDDPTPYTSTYIQENNIDIKPGFLTAEIADNGIIVYYYSFNDRKIIKEKEFIKTFKNTNN